MAAATTQLPNAPVHEGEILAAKYRIEKVIGLGGMGVVVSAMHLELDQRVALKFLLPQAQMSDELIGRFMREARASVKLKGPHVAKTHDVGRMDDGRAYIVMEYLEGKDLGAEIKAAAGGPFAISEAVGWMLEACEGLAEAHALGIIHRDLKPANLFLARGDTKPTIKVLDFGISKSINPNASDMLSLTKTEMLLGSPLYMAPEQMRSSKYVDERSDIWALGAITYELLTGHVPFEADTLLDLCFKVAQEGCIPAKDVRPEIPTELSAIVMRCLDKDVDGRWNDIGELATALEPFARPEDRGSAARTVAILAGGSRPPRPPRAAAPSEPRTPVSPAVTLTVSSTRAVVRADDQVTTGNASTERAPMKAGARTQTPEHDVAPDTIPASSAWGATSSQPVPKKSNMRGPFAIAVLAVAATTISYVVTRGASAPVSTATTAPEIVAPASPPPLLIVPKETVTPSDGVVASSSSSLSSSAPAAVVLAPAPRPKPKPVTSAAPAESSGGGFIKVRE